MKGDYSRETFDAGKHYSGVRMQQGRVQLDADWNEQMDILLYRLETEVGDFIGASGVPRELNDGRSFAVDVGGDPDNPVFSLAPGRYYIRGRLFENDNRLSMSAAELAPDAAPGTYLAYLDTWQSSVSAAEDPGLREVALGGPDTATRVKNVWRLRLERQAQDLAPAAGWLPSERGTPAGGMALRRREGAAALGNQLYRVEIHQGGPTSAASFKWSRDNGAVVAQVRSVRGQEIELAAAPRDSYAAFRDRDWVELLTHEQAERGEPGRMVQLSAAAAARLTAAAALGDDDADGRPPYQIVRRWDGPVTRLSDEDWIALEAGLEVRFAGEDAGYHAGDYWQFAARAAAQSIDWPASDALQPPRGVRHDYVPLALLHRDEAGAWSVREDLRQSFWALDKGAVSKLGDTMTGPLTIAPPAGAPALEVQGDAQVDGRVVSADLRVSDPQHPAGLPASVAVEPLRVVRGVVASDGTIDAGAGFRIERPESPELATTQHELIDAQATIQQHDAEIARLNTIIAAASMNLQEAEDILKAVEAINPQLPILQTESRIFLEELSNLRISADRLHSQMSGIATVFVAPVNQLRAAYATLQSRIQTGGNAVSSLTLESQAIRDLDNAKARANQQADGSSQIIAVWQTVKSLQKSFIEAFFTTSLTETIRQLERSRAALDRGRINPVTQEARTAFTAAQAAARPTEEAMQQLVRQTNRLLPQLAREVNELQAFVTARQATVDTNRKQIAAEQQQRAEAESRRDAAAARLAKLQAEATGRYRLVFNPPFSDLPAVTVTPIRSGDDEFYLAVTAELLPDRVDVSIIFIDGKDTSARFSFVAVGMHRRGQP